MLKTIIIYGKSVINKIKHKTFHLTKPKRSSKWNKVRDHFLKQHPACEVCGTTKDVQIHHIKPYHDFPELELDVNNLIALCAGEKDHHLKLGHAGNYKLANSHILIDIAEIKLNPKQTELIIQARQVKKKI